MKHDESARPPHGWGRCERAATGNSEIGATASLQAERNLQASAERLSSAAGEASPLQRLVGWCSSCSVPTPNHGERDATDCSAQRTTRTPFCGIRGRAKDPPCPEQGVLRHDWTRRYFMNHGPLLNDDPPRARCSTEAFASRYSLIFGAAVRPCTPEVEKNGK